MGGKNKNKNKNKSVPQNQKVKDEPKIVELPDSDDEDQKAKKNQAKGKGHCLFWIQMSFFSIFDTEVTKVEDEIKKESKPIIEAPKGKVSHH